MTNGAAGRLPGKPGRVLAEVERGHIKDNLVPITPELVAALRFYWRALVPPDV